MDIQGGTCWVGRGTCPGRCILRCGTKWPVIADVLRALDLVHSLSDFTTLWRSVNCFLSYLQPLSDIDWNPHIVHQKNNGYSPDFKGRKSSEWILVKFWTWINHWNKEVTCNVLEAAQILSRYHWPANISTS